MRTAASRKGSASPLAAIVRVDAEQGDQLGAAVDVELLVDVADMGLRCAVGNDELGGHGAGRLALEQQDEHLLLPLSQVPRSCHGIHGITAGGPEIPVRTPVVTGSEQLLGAAGRSAPVLRPPPEKSSGVLSPDT